MKSLVNDKMKLLISEHGAELTSIRAKGNEYLWQADPKFWNRHSPVLFPFVGRVWNNEYRLNGQVYPMGQHGFARDMEFEQTGKSADSIKFTLVSNEATLAKYPFPFVLEIGYKLIDNSIEVSWTVKNTGDSEMHFQIGAHPAFYYRDLDTSSDKRGYLLFGKGVTELDYIFPVEKGCTSLERRTLKLDDGKMEVTTSSFDCDTYIFDNKQLSKITLADKEGKPYLSMSFDTPLVAVWSPAATRPDVPFICLEPWFGRCDRMNYTGELKDRDCIEHLAAGATFSTRYLITLEDV